jgi:PBP1b-binding outer membrane lipoprotein LpoB
MKTTLMMTVIALMLSGCADTWNGVKSDSSAIWEKTKTTTGEVVDGTKSAIHKATE